MSFTRKKSEQSFNLNSRTTGQVSFRLKLSVSAFFKCLQASDPSSNSSENKEEKDYELEDIYVMAVEESDYIMTRVYENF